MDGLEGRAGGCEDAVAVARSVNNVEFIAGVDDVVDADERAMPSETRQRVTMAIGSAVSG